MINFQHFNGFLSSSLLQKFGSISYDILIRPLFYHLQYRVAVDIQVIQIFNLIFVIHRILCMIEINIFKSDVIFNELVSGKLLAIYRLQQGHAFCIQTCLSQDTCLLQFGLIQPLLIVVLKGNLDIAIDIMSC